MKAIVLTAYGGPEVLTLCEVPEPEPGAEDILVRVKTTSVNRADLLQRMGGYPQPGPRSEYEIPGLEFAGVVEAVGKRVMLWNPGDRVFGLLPGGGYAEKIVVHERLAMPIPDNLSWEEAGGVPEVFLTAYDALFERVFLKMGETVLVHAGGSGVGSAAIQLARAAGAQVLTTVGSPEKAERVRRLGATPILYREQDFAEAARAATAGQGVQAILDFIGGPYLEGNLKALAPLGRLVEIGLMGGRSGQIDLGLLLNKRLTVVGTVLRARSLEEKISLTQAFTFHALPLLANGSVRPIVDRVFPLTEVAEAHRYMASNQNFGKIVLRVQG